MNWNLHLLSECLKNSEYVTKPSMRSTLATLLVALAGCTSEVVLSVPDMMCEESCAVKVREVLAEQPGVQRVNVDFPKRVARLSVSMSNFSADGAVAALVDHGFENSKLKTNNAQVVPTRNPAAHGAAATNYSTASPATSAH